MFCLCIHVGPTVIVRESGEMFSVQFDTPTVLLCEATHDPAATVTYSWTKDGNPLLFNSRITLEDGNRFGNLQIASVLYEDAGVYQCTVRTSVSGIEGPVVRSTSTMLSVTGQ